MNRDLMMKAAVKFKGVWPDQEETHLYKFHYGRFVTGMAGGTADVVCTREQFENFVESLFEGAPKGATHYSPEDENNEQAWWKLVGDEMLCICETGSIYIWERGHFDKTIQLIPRPAKKLFIGDTPQQLKDGVTPWVPEIGEECKSALLGSHFTVGRLLYKSDQLVIWQDSATGAEFAGKLENRIFRPLRTERELFIEQATKDYLDQVGSDAVNAKWFERIFGALYDAGYKKTRD
jgi:hypothetical protein